MQDVTLHSQEGKETAGRGELRLYGQSRRTTLAVVYAVFGLLFGLPTLVPGPHMCITWIFPVAGAYMALRTWTTEAELSSLEGTCPACEEKLDLPGGALTADGTMQQVCLNCRATFEVRATLPDSG